MTTTQIVIVCTTVLAALAMLLGRNLSVTFRDVKATVERTNSTLGNPNGGGDAMTQLASLDSRVEAVQQELEDRTHITRLGRKEPEELGPYIQSRLHDVLGAQTLLSLKVDFLWRAAVGQGWDLPDLPSMQEPTEESN